MRLIFFLCTLLSLTAKGQVVANFGANITEGCEGGFRVQFSDLTNLPDNPENKWDWDFGNNRTATAQNPSIVYFDPGSYTVKLTVTDPSGRKYQVTKEHFIVVNKKPTPDFTASKTSGCVPFTVKFNDQSSAGSGTITKWEWDFGDGKTSLLQSPIHTYEGEGIFNITLKVTNSLGCEKVETKSSFIHVNTLPKADFISGSTLSCNPPASVNFSSTSTGGSIVDTKWKFGDGATSSGTNTSHIYTTAGTYPVTLIVTNQNGCVDSITKPTVIGSVTPAFTAPGTVCQGAPISFVNASSPATASAYWDFGDNTSSTDINPVKKFTTDGTFTVKLVNDFGACKDSITKQITVIPKPDGRFSAIIPSSTCKVPLDVSFTASATNAVSYLWDFGDGSNSTVPDPTHTYTNYDSFTVKLIVSASNGCTDTVTKQKLISIVPPKINTFIGLPFGGCLPRQQTFSASITSPEPVASYLWDFGNGTTSTEINPTYGYTAEGSYDVSLKITTNSGCTDVLTLPKAVTVSKKPTADFSADPLISCAKDPVQFTDHSTGNITEHQWTFHDGGESDETNPLHKFSDTGFFNIRLVVSNRECRDTLIRPKYVYIKPPIGRFNVIYDCEKPFERHFQNTSIPATGSHWEFGDGSVSDEVSPIYVYKNPGTYYVHLHIINGDCFDDFTDTIQVIDEHPRFTIDQNALCRNNTSVFTATEIDPKNIATYTWDFGDNTAPLSRTTPTINHNYLRPGKFKPKLTVTDILGCTRTFEQTVDIIIYGPNAAFINPEGGCINSKVIFTDKSEPTSNHPITSWILDYGDGSSDTSITTPGFSHIYTAPQKYNLSLIVTDSYGCKDTLFKPEAINITKPRALFSTSDSISCKNSTIVFINQSAGLNLTSTWDFGDGTKVAEQSPQHSYQSESDYSVSLAVVDQYGCTDTLVKEGAVAVRNAKASFTLSDSVISCPPTQIDFKNTSLYSTGVRWDFDDGNFATIPDPSHYFLAARTYHIKLIAYGHGSCADSTVKDINVKGPNSSFTYTPVTSCVPAAIDFQGRASNSNNSFTWDFGDGTATTTSQSSISHVYTTPGKFLPKLLVIDTALNCKVSFFGVDTVRVSGAVTYVKQQPLLFCDSTNLQFFDSTITKYDRVTSYSWEFGDGTYSDEKSPSHKYTAPGVFPVHLTVKTAGGCTNSSENTFVKVVKSPHVKIAGPASACINDPVIFSGVLQRDTSFLKWSWQFGNGERYNKPSPPAQTYSIPGKYQVNLAVTNSSGCTTKDSASLIVNPLPDVNAGKDSVICKGASFMLRPSGGDNYLWRNNPSLSCTSCANPVASPVDFSVYYVTGTNALTGCRQTDSVRITVVQPFTVMAVNGDTICVGQQVNLLASGTDQYAWTPAAGLTNTNTANPVAHPDTTTLYTVIGHDNYNCFRDTAYVPIVVYPNPVFNIVDDNITVAAGTAVTLKTSSSGDISAWQWFPATGLSCSNCQEPVATANNTISYKAIASNPGGCRAEDRVTIQVFCNNGNVFIPNTFSPNNDGSNDVFYPRGKGIAGIKNLRIFNRWGVVVFEKSNFAANDPTAGWDGTYKGKPVDADVFIYQAEVICQTGEAFAFKGDITVIR